MKKLVELEKQIAKKKELLKKSQRTLDIKQVNENKKARKKRAHELIQLGALFEIAELKNENKALLLGYLLNFKNLSFEEKERLGIEGQREFNRREKESGEKRMNEEKVFK